MCSPPVKWFLCLYFSCNHLHRISYTSSAANQAIVWAFNFAIYPFVIYRFGILKGGVVMTFLSFIVCMLTIWFYDWAKRDWLGIEAIKSLKE